MAQTKKQKGGVRFRTIIHYYWLQMKKYRWSFFSALSFYATGTLISNGVTPVLYRRLIDAISSEPEKSAIAQTLFHLLFFVVIAAVASNIAYRLADYLLWKSQRKIIRALANDAFVRITRHSYSFFSNTFVGSLVASTRRYIDAFQNMQEVFAFNFWMNGLLLVVVLVVLFQASPGIAIFFFLWSVAFIAIVLLFIRKQRPYDLAEAAEDSKVTGRIADVITNILNIKMFASSRREYDAFTVYTGRQEEARRQAWNFEIVMYAAQGTLMMLLEIVGMYLSIRFWLAGALSTGTVVLVQLYFGRIFNSLWFLGNSISRFTRTLSNASELVEVFEKKSDISDPDAPEEFHIAGGEIVFDRVTFAYHKQKIFSDFSLKIRAGEKVGIVGHSGAGKTTITKLILRFADVEEGAVLVDGQDVRRLKQDDLRAAISYVPQDPILFHRSLGENIAYGKPGASESEVIEAAKKAHAHDFVSAFPLEYETLVGERGVKLSGGERQRVAIARAMLKNAPILLLDEATSSLDSLSERYIQDAFAELMQGKTTVVIAHRLSTIQKMDRIIVLEKGVVTEDGTHDALLARKGIYYTLWTHQVSGFIA
ncbi:MAG: ABC transporter ATP-binding protein [bacterium]|nr:ABC transporter ATP-binding protein [bacterium]MDZ4284430.1 ABC transporter ATP-binding protein [Patescibacteria group bacterium]